MKKLTVAAVALCTTIAFSYCKKESGQQNRMANTVVVTTNQELTNFVPEPHSGNKSNLGQADIN